MKHKRKGGREKRRVFFYHSAMPLSQPDVMPEHERFDQGLLSKRPPPFKSFPVLGKSFFTGGKLVFSSQNLAPGTFSKCNFGGRRVKNQYGFP